VLVECALKGNDCKLARDELKNRQPVELTS